MSDDLRSNLAIAEGCLRSLSVRLDHPRLIQKTSRNRLTRAEVVGGLPCASVVIKENLVEPDRHWTEAAGFQFLRDHYAFAVAPRLLATDRKQRVLVLEDLGDSDSFNESHAISLAKQMARLNCMPLDAEKPGFLTAATRGAIESEAKKWPTSVDRFWNWFTAFDLERPVIRDLVENAAADPGPWLAFTHGDPAPSNVHLSQRGLHFVDFEYCGFRHALHDLTRWEALVSTSAQTLRSMRNAYREELALAFPIARDVAAFDVIYARQLLLRAIGVTAWFPKDILNKDQPTPGGGMRRQVMYAFNRVASAASQIPSLHSLADAITTRLLPAMRAAWSVDS